MTENEQDELIQLLNSRNELEFNKRKWERLFLLIKSVIYIRAKSYNIDPSIDALDIISDFIEKKLLLTQLKFKNIKEFRAIFNNYCKDLYRKQTAQKRNFKITDSLESKTQNSSIERGDFSKEQVFIEIKQELEKKGFKTNQDDISNMSFSNEDVKTLESAKSWLETMERDEGIWITAYLGIHICPSDRSMALSTLGKMMHLESYNYKAQRLGIKKGFWKDYKKTFIGQWMLQLDIPIGEEPITEETESIMLHCLKILCQVALLRVTDPIYQNLMSRT